MVEYKLKDINRYEETYFRNGQMLLKEEAALTNLFPKSYLFNQVDDGILNTSRNDELRMIP